MRAFETTEDIRRQLNARFSPHLQLDNDVSTILGIPFPSQAGRSRVPDLDLFTHDALTEYDFQLMRKIAIALDLNVPILIEGGSGIGKSQSTDRVCSLLGMDSYYANCHDFSADVLIGAMTTTPGSRTGFGWVDGIAVQAIRNGGVLFLDEYNFMLGETRGRLHEILDSILREKGSIILVENRSEVVPVHPDFRIVAAQNPPGEGFSDRYFLDAAQMGRFQYCKEPSALSEHLKLSRTLQALGVNVSPELDSSLILSVENSMSRIELLSQPHMPHFLQRFAHFHHELEGLIRDRDVALDQSQPLYLSFQRELNRILAFMGRYWTGSVQKSGQAAMGFVYENMFESPTDKNRVHDLIVNATGKLREKTAADIKSAVNGTGQSHPAFLENGKYVEICGVKLPKGNGGPRTPEADKFRRNVLTSFDRSAIQKVAIGMALNQPVLMEGGSGLGKSERVEWICALLNRECYYANCQDFGPEVLIGTMNPRDDTVSGFGWTDGVAVAAIRNGGVLFLDEYNFMSGETRGRLHEILDAVIRGNPYIVLVENGGELVPVHPDFRLVAAQNPPGDLFLDRTILDPAQLTRFVYIKDPSQMPLSVKLARALSMVGIEVGDNALAAEQIWPGHQALTLQQLKDIPGAVDLLAGKFVQFHKAITSVVANGDLAEFQPQPLSFAFQRDLDRVMEYMTSFYDGDLNSTMRSALTIYFMNRFESREDREKVREMMSHVMVAPKADARRTTLTVLDGHPVDALEIEGLTFLTDLINRGIFQNDLLEAISGFSSDIAYKWRELSDPADPKRVLRSLCGTDDERAMKLRLKFSRSGLEDSLIGLDSLEVVNLRKAAGSTPSIRAVSGLDTALAKEVRERCQKVMNTDPPKPRVSYVTPRSVSAAAGMQMQQSPEEIRYANSMAEITGRPYPSSTPVNLYEMLVMSFAGLNTREAKDTRSSCFSFSENWPVLLRSCAFVDDIEIEELQQLVLEKNARQDPSPEAGMQLKPALLEGLAGVDTSFAWRHRDEAKRELASHPELLDPLCRSLAGLTSQRAWKMRKELADEAASPEQLGIVAKSITGGHFLAGIRRAKKDRELSNIRLVRLMREECVA